MSNQESRYARVSRRALLKRGAGLGALVLLPGLACGQDDTVLVGVRTASGQTSAQVPTTAPLEAPATVRPNAVQPTPLPPAPTLVPPTAAAAEPTAVPPAATAEAPTTVPPAATAEAPTAVPPAATAATALAAGTQAEIGFTYSQASGGKNLPPYIAVWIEDGAGELAATVALWYQQSRGERWLPDLTRWHSVDQARIQSGGPSQVDVISSATRLPGSFNVAWDGTTHDGQPAAAGDYFVCIESARERGPYSLVRTPVTLVAATMTVDLGSDGELSGASVTTRA